MSTSSGAARLKTPLALALLASLLTAVISSFMLLPGITLSSDGWAYWESSVSLLRGCGYAYLGGQPIVSWPPLFSLYLSGLELLTGVNGRTLTVAITILASAASFVWSYLFVSLTNPEPKFLWHRLLIAVFVVAFVTDQFRRLLSETLFLLLLGCLLLVVTRLSLRGGAYSRRMLVGVLSSIGLLSTLLLFTRNVAIAYIPGLVVVTWFALGLGKPLRNAFLAGLPFALSIGCWSLLRFIAGQGESHAIGNGGIYTNLEYGQQFLLGFAELLLMPVEYVEAVVSAAGGPSNLSFGLMRLSTTLFLLFLVGLGLVALIRRGRPQVTAVCLAGAAMAVGILGTWVLFNMVTLIDRLDGRWLWGLVLTAVGVLGVLSTWLSQGTARFPALAILAIIAVLQFSQTSSHAVQFAAGVETPNVRSTDTIEEELATGLLWSAHAVTPVYPRDEAWIDRDYARKSGNPDRNCWY